MRITRKDIDRKFVYYRETMIAHKYPYAESLTLETWSPGDGWTRYYIECTDTKGITHDVTDYMNHREIYTFMATSINVLHSINAGMVYNSGAY